jgi:hypothetical protein
MFHKRSFITNEEFHRRRIVYHTPKEQILAM